MKKLLIFALVLATPMFYSCNSDSDSSDDDIEYYDETDGIYLSDFSSTSVPSYDEWVISDEEADTEDFEGLYEALAAITTSGREISLSFPNLTSFPDYAIFGQDEVATYSEIVYETDDDGDEIEVESGIMTAANVLVSISADVATSIGDYAFAFCNYVTELNFPEVTRVGDKAFQYCSSLTSISQKEFPNVIWVGDAAFSLCLSLTSVELPTITWVNKKSFALCKSLTSFEAQMVTNIGEWAFSGCTSLPSVYFPLVEEIEYAGFYYCTALSEVYLPEVTNVGAWAFSYNTAFESFELPKATNLGTQAFYSCAFESVSFPAVTRVNDGVFYSCTNLADAYLPEVTVIGEDAFRNCSALSDLFIATNSGVTLELIDANAFFDTDTTSIDLAVGTSNAQYINGNYLTVGSFSEQFQSVVAMTAL